VAWRGHERRNAGNAGNARGLGGGFGGGSHGHALAGIVGSAVLWVCVGVVIAQVLLMAWSIIYLRLTEGIDTQSAEDTLESTLADAKRRASEVGNRARQAADRVREQAEAASRKVGSSMPGRGDQPGAPAGSTPPGTMPPGPGPDAAAAPGATPAASAAGISAAAPHGLCVQCRQPLDEGANFCGFCGTPVRRA